MRVQKSLICLILVIIMILSIPAPVHASTLPFTDVPTSHTYYDAIKYVYDRGIMNGISSTEFASANTLNRAMMVVTLYRMSGSNELIDPVGFTDVPEGTFYYYAVGWGQAYGIVNGTTETTFSPISPLTRQQFMVFLHRYATEYEGYSYTLPTPNVITRFNDYSSITDFAKTASNWAVNCGIYPSYATTFNPHVTVTRGECAEYLFKYLTLCCSDVKAFEALDFVDMSVCHDICETINNSTSRILYATTQIGLTPLAMEFAFYNSSIIYSSSHGESDRINLNYGDLVYSDIAIGSMEHVDLVYLSACYAGNDFAEYIHETAGAEVVIGYKDTVSGLSADDGIYLFDKIFFEYYARGNSPRTAFIFAQSDIPEDEFIESGLCSKEIYD